MTMTRQRSKYLHVSYLIESLRKMRKFHSPPSRFTGAPTCPLTFALGTCLCPCLVGAAGDTALALEQEAFPTLDRHVLINIELLFRKHSILRDHKWDRAWICC